MDILRFLQVSILQSTTAIDWNRLGNWATDYLFNLVTFLIFGLLVFWLARAPLRRWADQAQHSPFKSTGFGLLVILAFYLGAVLVLAIIGALGVFFAGLGLTGLAGVVFVVGLPALGLGVGVFTVFVFFISKVVVAFLAGRLLLEKLFPKAVLKEIWALLLGVVLYLLVSEIPWLGWAIGVIATLLGMGAIWLGLRPSKPGPALEAQSPGELLENKAEDAPEQGQVSINSGDPAATDSPI